MVEDLSVLSDEELDYRDAELATEAAAASAIFKERGLAIQAERTRRADEVRRARFLDTLTDEDKEALRQHLALPPAEG
jgi:hypothetical protein